MNKFLSRLWTVAALLPLVVLGLVLAAQTLPALDSRALWFSDEIRYANVFEHVVHAKKWLVMYLNGVPYPDKPPVYFWFLTAFIPFFGSSNPTLFFAGAAASALLFIAAMLTMNRLVLRGGRETGLAAGIILLTCFYFVALTHYSRMDLLFAAIITAAHVCLFGAWQREKAMGLTVAGFVLAAVATLTKGPLGLVFPLLASVVYLAWSGRLYRLFRRDVAVGIGAALGILLAWIGAAWIGGEHDLVNNIFYKQIYRRAVNASHHEQPFWHYFATFPAAFLPWTFVAFLLPFGKLVKGEFWKSLWYARHADVDSEGSGKSYLWCALVSGFVLLTCLSTKIVVYLLPLFPPLVLLTAQAVLAFDAVRTRRLMLAVAGLFALLAVATPLVNIFTQWPEYLSGLWLLAVACGVVALVLWRYATRFDIRAALITLAALVTLWVQPLALVAVPELDSVMSPREQAEVMGEFIEAGYTPAAYKIYSGVYTYYCGANVLETQDLNLITGMATGGERLVLGMQKRYWDSWENRPENLHVIHEQWIADRPYVLAVNTPGDAPVAADVTVTAPALPVGEAAEAPAPTAAPEVPAATPAPVVPALPVMPETVPAPVVPEAAPTPVPAPVMETAPIAPIPTPAAQPEAVAPAADAAPAAPAEPGLFSKILDALGGFAADAWHSLTAALADFWTSWTAPKGDVHEQNEGTGLFMKTMQWLSDVTRGDVDEPDMDQPILPETIQESGATPVGPEVTTPEAAAPGTAAPGAIDPDATAPEALQPEAAPAQDATNGTAPADSTPAAPGDGADVTPATDAPTGIAI
ncbi:4-amino-4-deoxy-L-arabinose transferase-like glycosyltransferase [Desulfobaculum xiamenense]|uniref:4-amino-4-deoxy-L-arabinose transferase-like glycosyltransferase n=1 Tax=Desulfobaculum xiamenense TaxID=995050 RepID=A0A846QK37_9BACT|nr:glycosyltransferase family 39 protein [Desulfobaculum xiamenense]NJB67420.1 4-amino-4-deoxy-L-arabinose transferase-like glycosyltransferase [Desulfobaculum xiamenense]